MVCYTRGTWREKTIALEQNNKNYSAFMVLSQDAQTDIQWWLDNVDNPRKFRTSTYLTTIYTDASDLGWGAACSKQEAFGYWSPDQIKWSINFKELMAIKMALSALADNLIEGEILLRVDNTSAIAYINRMGGVRFQKYHALATDMELGSGKRHFSLRILHTVKTKYQS